MSGHAFNAVRAELARAARLHGPDFASVHEGYAVLLEEVDELWDEIKKPGDKRDREAARVEAIQVAAMALKLARRIRPEFASGPVAEPEGLEVTAEMCRTVRLSWVNGPAKRGPWDEFMARGLTAALRSNREGAS